MYKYFWQKWMVAVVAMASAGHVDAADIVAATHIDQVTVYREGATIVRTTSIDLPAGDHRLIVRGLPEPLDPGKLRVSMRSPQVRLAGIEIEKVVDAKLVNESERKLNRKIRDLQDQRLSLQDEIATADTQLKLLDSITKSPGSNSERPTMVDGAALTGVLTTVGSGGDAIRARIRQATFKTREIDEQIEAVKEELRKVVTGSKATTELRANVRSASAATIPLTIEYQVVDAGWKWLYEVRLDSELKHVSLVRQAAVRQGTGEEWMNVELTVASSKPSEDAATPAISPLFLNLVARSPYRGAVGLEEIVVTAQRKASARRSSDETDEGFGEPPIVSAEVFSTDFVANYRIPGRVNVAADRQTRIYPIAEGKFDVNLVARAVLAAERAARLEAAFTYEAEVPIESGEVQLYRDGAFIGFANLPTVLPGAAVRMPFGVDERIRIVIHDEREQSGRRGILGKHRYDEHKRRFEVTSYHANALAVEVIDRVPVPKDSDIQVEVLDGSTPPSIKDLEGKEGVYLWRLEGTPRKTETIRHYYSIRFPKDKGVDAREGS